MFPDVPELPKHSLPFTALAPLEESSKSDGDEASAGFFAGHKVSILDLDKATLLQCLYKHATCNGDLLAYLPFAELQKDMQTLTYQEAEQLIAKKNQDLCFDFIKGKPIKVDVGGGYIITNGYDSFHGEGQCEAAVKEAFSRWSSVQEHSRLQSTEGLDIRSLIHQKRP